MLKILFGGSSSCGSIISRHHFSRHLAYTFEAKEKYTPVFCAFIIISIFVHEDNHPWKFANLWVPFLNTRPLDTRELATELLAFQVGFHYIIII